MPADAPRQTAGNGHYAAGPATVTGTRPVVLVRYRAGLTGETARMVHLVSLHPGAQQDAAGVALCGALLHPDVVEIVQPGQGMPCSGCLLSQAATSLPPVPTVGSMPADGTVAQRGSHAATMAYQAWGWPVIHRRDQVWLTLDPAMVALIMPMRLATQVSTILRQRRCPPLVLAHPGTPDHYIVLAGERYDIALP